MNRYQKLKTLDRIHARIADINCQILNLQCQLDREIEHLDRLDDVDAVPMSEDILQDNFSLDLQDVLSDVTY